MSLFSWFDNRTLYACQCMLSVMFAVVFLWMSRAYPSVRGIRSVAGAFLVGIPCTFLLLSRGHIPDLYSVAIADLLAAACFILLYNGIVRFVGGRVRLGLVCGASVIAGGAVFYFSEVRPSVVPRIVAMGLVASLNRGLTAWELLRALSSATSHGDTRSATRFFGVVLALMAGSGLVRAALAAIVGVPDGLMQGDTGQTSQMLLNVAFIGVNGLCFLTMAGHELILRSQEESEKDLLSSALNRRGIESRLATELKRSSRSLQRLSVALVDIDNFKTINDRYGHATGDSAIREVSLALSTTLRDGDYLGRYGGDEFLVILPMTAANQAAIAAERLRRAVGNLPAPAGDRSLTLSIGITEASPDDDAISLIARADEALYQAKSSGRNCLRTTLPVTTFPNGLPAVPKPQTSQAMQASAQS